VLNEILDRAAERAIDATIRVDDFKALAEALPPARSLAEALLAPGLSVIAEIKRRSPSVGDIDTGLDPIGRARAYVDGGASAISVLTEPDYFAGSMQDLAAVRTAVDVPVLRKDFTLAGAQIWEARAGGADAILLIVAAMTGDQLCELLGVAGEVGVDAIVEAHTESEAQRAIDAGATIIGVNNRDLATFRADLSVAESVANILPEDVVTIGESGVSDAAGAARMRAAGYDAILVGEALVRADDPADLVRLLKGAP
jgi:indole-3-glycerol phosphate synthase